MRNLAFFLIGMGVGLLRDQGFPRRKIHEIIEEAMTRAWGKDE